MTELVEREPSREGGQYDVFLSYNSADVDVVEGLARRLRTANLAVWFDRWRIPSGDDWQDHLAEGLVHSDACLVFLGPHGVSDWAKQELKVAIDRAARSSYRIVPVLLPGVAVPFEPTEELPPFLRLRSWLDLRDGVEGADVVEQLVRAVKGIAPGAPAVAAGVCPYPGLRAFDEADHERFFGRDADIAQLVEKLRAHRFLAVVGPSGSGKSSLVRAGLLPALRRQQRPDEAPARLVVMRPGARPLAELAAQLTALGHPQPTGQLADALHDDERSWALALSTLLATSNGQIVWVVDQFEELFTLVRDGAERPFISNLVWAAGEVDAVRIVITLRADFYARCAEHPELAQLLAAHQHLVTPLTVDGWRAAVEEPAWRGGLELQAGLVPTILDDAVGRPGGLPLLQEALVATWERRAGNLLTLDGYLGGGRVAGAVARQADLAFDALTPVEQRAARAILQRLVQLGEGTADTRRQCQAAELVAAGDDEAVVGRVLQHLAAARLVTSAQDASGVATIDLSHEALITEWPRLRGWLDENREQLRVRQRLHEQATEWLDRDRDESLLYRGAQLRFAVDQLERSGLELSPLERSFLDESIADADRVEAERAAAELDLVRRRERERTRRRVLVGLSAVLVLVALVAVYAVAQSREAGRQRDIASALRLAAQSDVVGRQQADLGLLLGLQAQDRADTVEARASVMNALSRSPRPARYLRPPDGTRVTAMALSPDSAFVIAELSDGTASLWDRATGASLGRWPSEGHGVGSATAFSPSGQLVATGYQDGSVVVRRLPLGDVVAAVGAHQRRVDSVSFVDDSTLVSAASDQPQLVSFASGPNATAVSIGPADQAVGSVAVDPASSLLATASDGAVQVWRLPDSTSDGPLQPGFPPRVGARWPGPPAGRRWS